MTMQKSMRRKGLFAALFALFMLFSLVGCGGGSAKQGDGTATASSSMAKGQKLQIHVLDVGQGDAILIEAPRETILIDTGDKDMQSKLRSELKRYHVKRIDKLILTHPHADHIGGAMMVLKEFDVAALCDNGQTHASVVYRNLMKYVRDKKIPYRTIGAGDAIEFGGGIKFTAFAPTQALLNARAQGPKGKDKPNYNDGSIVGRLTYGDFSMLFTGDAGKLTEDEMLLHNKKDLRSDLLKVGHHGSNTSTTEKFLKAVNPSAAVISCGSPNDYHHPHPSTRKRLQKHKIDYYRTDKNGTITIETTGKGDKDKLYRITVQRGTKNNDEGN